MTNITIPPEALEAVKKIIKDCFFTNESDAATEARAVCLAMLEAWPDMVRLIGQEDEHDTILLPLPLTETSE